MIQDYQTNMVYLAEGLRYYKPVYTNLLRALEKESIPYRFLPGTQSKKHIWARDYMPIQLEKDKFMVHEYSPDYLVGFEDYIPNYEAIVKDLNLNCIVTDIDMDGGNVVKCGKKVIMTNKIIRGNLLPYVEDIKDRLKRRLINSLEDYMKAEIILIPQDRYDEYGHADGMVRYIGANDVLMNCYENLDPNLHDQLKDILSRHFHVETLHFKIPRCSKYVWAYINFLQVGRCIFVPGLGIEEDKLAIEQIQSFYPNHKVILIDGCMDLVREGGALNCISWNILTDLPKEE
ncbi:MAG: agmatine deiminase family protein [Bacteroidaceae bacterium]|nr:agmatine deiminase family protein [Bacteroidaceae bacterium]